MITTINHEIALSKDNEKKYKDRARATRTTRKTRAKDILILKSHLKYYFNISLSILVILLLLNYTTSQENKSESNYKSSISYTEEVIKEVEEIAQEIKEVFTNKSNSNSNTRSNNNDINNYNTEIFSNNIISSFVSSNSFKYFTLILNPNTNSNNNNNSNIDNDKDSSSTVKIIDTKNIIIKVSEKQTPLKYCDPNLFVSLQNKNPNNSKNAEYISSKEGEDLIIISNINNEKEVYIGVSSSRDCEFNLQAQLVNNWVIKENENTSYSISKSSAIMASFYQDKPSFSYLRFNAFSKHNKKFRLYVSKSNVLNASQVFDVTSGFVDSNSCYNKDDGDDFECGDYSFGYSVFVNFNSNEFCFGCYFYLVLDGLEDNVDVIVNVEYFYNMDKCYDDSLIDTSSNDTSSDNVIRDNSIRNCGNTKSGLELGKISNRDKDCFLFKGEYINNYSNDNNNNKNNNSKLLDNIIIETTSQTNIELHISIYGVLINQETSSNSSNNYIINNSITLITETTSSPSNTLLINNTKTNYDAILTCISTTDQQNQDIDKIKSNKSTNYYLNQYLLSNIQNHQNNNYLFHNHTKKGFLSKFQFTKYRVIEYSLTEDYIVKVDNIKGEVKVLGYFCLNSDCFFTSDMINEYLSINSFVLGKKNDDNGLSTHELIITNDINSCHSISNQNSILFLEEKRELCKLEVLIICENSSNSNSDSNANINSDCEFTITTVSLEKEVNLINENEVFYKSIVENSTDYLLIVIPDNNENDNDSINNSNNKNTISQLDIIISPLGGKVKMSTQKISDDILSINSTEVSLIKQIISGNNNSEDNDFNNNSNNNSNSKYNNNDTKNYSLPIIHTFSTSKSQTTNINSTFLSIIKGTYLIKLEALSFSSYSIKYYTRTNTTIIKEIEETEIKEGLFNSDYIEIKDKYKVYSIDISDYYYNTNNTNNKETNKEEGYGNKYNDMLRFYLSPENGDFALAVYSDLNLIDINEFYFDENKNEHDISKITLKQLFNNSIAYIKGSQQLEIRRDQLIDTKSTENDNKEKVYKLYIVVILISNPSLLYENRSSYDDYSEESITTLFYFNISYITSLNSLILKPSLPVEVSLQPSSSANFKYQIILKPGESTTTNPSILNIIMIKGIINLAMEDKNKELLYSFIPLIKAKDIRLSDNDEYFNNTDTNLIIEYLFLIENKEISRNAVFIININDKKERLFNHLSKDRVIYDSISFNLSKEYYFYVEDITNPGVLFFTNENLYSSNQYNYYSNDIKPNNNANNDSNDNEISNDSKDSSNLFTIYLLFLSLQDQQLLKEKDYPTPSQQNYNSKISIKSTDKKVYYSLPQEELLKCKNNCKVLLSLTTTLVSETNITNEISLLYFTSKLKLPHRVSFKSYITKNTYQYFEIDVSNKSKILDIYLISNTGDADLFLNFGNSFPTKTSYNFKSSLSSMSDSIEIDIDNIFFDDLYSGNVVYENRSVDGKYVLGVYGYSDSEYVLFYTTHKEKIYEVGDSFSSSCVTTSSGYCYFEYRVPLMISAFFNSNDLEFNAKLINAEEGLISHSNSSSNSINSSEGDKENKDINDNYKDTSNNISYDIEKLNLVNKDLVVDFIAVAEFLCGSGEVYSKYLSLEEYFDLDNLPTINENEDNDDIYNNKDKNKHIDDIKTGYFQNNIDNISISKGFYNITEIINLKKKEDLALNNHKNDFSTYIGVIIIYVKTNGKSFFSLNTDLQNESFTVMKRGNSNDSNNTSNDSSSFKQLFINKQTFLSIETNETKTVELNNNYEINSQVKGKIFISVQILQGLDIEFNLSKKLSNKDTNITKLLENTLSPNSSSKYITYNFNKDIEKESIFVFEFRTRTNNNDNNQVTSYIKLSIQEANTYELVNENNSSANFGLTRKININEGKIFNGYFEMKEEYESVDFSLTSSNSDVLYNCYFKYDQYDSNIKFKKYIYKNDGNP